MDSGDASSVFLMLIGIAFAYLAVLHLVSPFAVLANVKIPCRYEFSPLDLQEALINAHDAAKRAIAELAELGFTPVAASLLDMANPSTAFFLLRKCEDPCVASVSTCSVGFDTVSAVEFCQLYEDGSLSLTNAPLPGIFPENPEKVIFRLPKNPDLRFLLSSFMALRAKSPCRCGPRSPAEGHELEMLERFCNDERALLCSLGIYSPPCSNGKCSLTLKGAYIFSWKLLWPWRGIRLRLAERRTLRALADSLRTG